MIEIYGKQGCGSCKEAKHFCETRNLPHIYKLLDIDFERDWMVETFPTARTFPQIVIHGQSIGGFQQLKTYVEETGYTGTGHTL